LLPQGTDGGGDELRTVWDANANLDRPAMVRNIGGDGGGEGKTGRSLPAPRDADRAAVGDGRRVGGGLLDDGHKPRRRAVGVVPRGKGASGVGGLQIVDQ